jgi:hypothetical protein
LQRARVADSARRPRALDAKYKSRCRRATNRRSTKPKHNNACSG